MAYFVHKTPGLVLGMYPSSERNNFIYVFTRELGLVQATAQGTRQMKSKLRYGLQQYSVSHFSFVYGKGIWRLTNVVPQTNLFYELRGEDEKLHVVAQSSALLKRLLTGEEKNEILFDIVTHAFSFLQKVELTCAEIKQFEFLLVLRILYQLGYISGSPGLELLAVGVEWNKKDISGMAEMKREAVAAINQAIVGSQL